MQFWANKQLTTTKIVDKIQLQVLVVFQCIYQTVSFPESDSFVDFLKHFRWVTYLDI